uniref:Uncharacterized protein n=1 Tax=Anguilla anguilla TaxID=7936 RepID=A0A0E9UTH2_ANGAN
MNWGPCRRPTVVTMSTFPHYLLLI